MSLIVNGVSPSQINFVDETGQLHTSNIYTYATTGVDLKEATRSSVSTYTKANLDSYVGMKNDTWGGITNASSLVADRYYYIRVLVSDTNKYGKFCVRFKSYSGQTITTENMGWGYDGEVIYSTPIWGKPFSLTTSQGTGVASLTVNRTASPNEHASTGALSSGATIHYGDVLSVSATASTGYSLEDYTTSYTVSGNITVSVTALTEIILVKNTHVKTISLTYVDSNGASQTVTAAGTYYAKNGSDYSWSATADSYCYMTSASSGNGKLSGGITISPTADYGYYTVSLSAITNATAYVNTAASNYASSITAKYGSTIYVQVKPNNCYIYTLSSTNYTPSSPYTTSYVLNSTNFNLSSTTPAASPTVSNIPTATKSIGGTTGAAYYKVTLTVTNGTVTSGATTTIRYGNSISYTAKGNSKYYYVDKTTGGYGDSGYSTTYKPTSSVLPADGGATEATAVTVSHNVGSCTAYKTYTIKTTGTGSCGWNTYVKSPHAWGETSFALASSGSTVYETDVFYSYAFATNMGGYKLTKHSCTNNNKTILPDFQFLTVGGSGKNTYWTTTSVLFASTGLVYRADFGTSDSPKTVNGNVDIKYEGAALTYKYYGYNSNIYSSKINSGTTYVNIYDSSKVSKEASDELVTLDFYPASAIRINGCIALQKDGTNSEFSNHPLTTIKTANLKYAGISGTAKMGNQGPASGNSGAEQRQYLNVSKKAGSYKFYIRIWGISIPS